MSETAMTTHQRSHRFGPHGVAIPFVVAALAVGCSTPAGSDPSTELSRMRATSVISFSGRCPQSEVQPWLHVLGDELVFLDTAGVLRASLGGGRLETEEHELLTDRIEFVDLHHVAGPGDSSPSATTVLVTYEEGPGSTDRLFLVTENGLELLWEIAVADPDRPDGGPFRINFLQLAGRFPAREARAVATVQLALSRRLLVTSDLATTLGLRCQRESRGLCLLALELPGISGRAWSVGDRLMACWVTAAAEDIHSFELACGPCTDAGCDGSRIRSVDRAAVLLDASDSRVLIGAVNATDVDLVSTADGNAQRFALDEVRRGLSFAAGMARLRPGGIEAVLFSTEASPQEIAIIEANPDGARGHLLRYDSSLRRGWTTFIDGRLTYSTFEQPVQETCEMQVYDPSML